MAWEFEQVVNLGTPKALTPPAGARVAVVQAADAPVRYNLTGDNPSATKGQVLAADGDPVTITDPAAIKAARFIAESGTPTLEVHYRLSDAP